MEYLEINKVIPDPNQPRKAFPADEMRSLKESIKRRGIKVPLSVEKYEGGKYILEDGERRWRAAKDLGLKKVPVVISEAKSPTDRLIMQFEIQEQHAGWTPVEKAAALNKLAESLGGTLLEVCEMFGMLKHEKELYSSFASLTDKESYVRNEVPLHYAAPFRSIRNKVKELYAQELNEEFIRSDEKALEHALIRSVKDGSITKNRDIVRLKDAFVKNPALIKKYMGNKASTPDSLFIEAKAVGVYYLRNLMIATKHAGTYSQLFVKNKGAKVTDAELASIKTTMENLQKVINLVEY